MLFIFHVVVATLSPLLDYFFCRKLFKHKAYDWILFDYQSERTWTDSLIIESETLAMFPSKLRI